MSEFASTDELDLARVRSEGWTDLAIVPKVGDATTQVHRGWAPEHVFVSPLVSLALIDELRSCTSIERLALPNANLGSLVESLGPLEELTHLDIRGNYLTPGDLEATLLSLPNLEFLDISGNRLPSLEKIDFLALRDTLRVLYLHNTGTDLTSIRQLGSLEFLEELKVSHNPVEPTFLKRLAALRRLRSLRLDHCKLDDRAGVHLGRLSGLESLGLNGTRIGEATTKSLTGLERLTELGISNTDPSDNNLHHVSSLHALTSLSVSGPRITRRGAGALASLKSLKHLTLHAEQLDDEGCQFLDEMPELVRLGLSVRTFGETMVRATRRHAKLATLSIRARLTHDVFSAVSSNLKNLGVWTPHEVDVAWLSHLSRTSLRQLRLSREASVGDDGARAISAVRSLVQLDLPDNGLTARGARHLSPLSRLETLNLSKNPLGDEGAEAIGALTSLVRLELRECRIGPRGASALGRLKNLKSLVLERNQIRDEGLASLRGFSKLEHLDLLGNGIGDVGAEVFSADSFPKLRSLNLPSNGIGTKGARAISRLPLLESLSLSGNPVGDDAVEALSSLHTLRSLFVTGHRVGPRGAQALGRMSALASLSLQNATIGPDGARALSNLSELESLHIHGCRIGDLGLKCILGMERLRYLHASRNEVETVSSRRRSSTIVGLFLDNNRITDESLHRMCREIDFESLQELDLSNNGISDRGLEELHRLPTLRRLRLGGNRLSVLSPRLISLEELAYVDLTNNPLEPDVEKASRKGVAELKRFLRVLRESTAKRSNYEVAPNCIAQGGQARVSRALDLTTNRRVAFKECLFPEDPEALARLQREIEALHALDHPNIMPMLDSCPDEGWLTMPIATYPLGEYADGRALADVDVFEVVEAVLGALDRAHGLGWVHRDLKPSNILYIPSSEDENGRWVVSDWGLVRRPAGQTTVPRRTKTGVGMGTEGFAPPELAHQAHRAGPSCDFWSLGQLVSWMTTGDPPLQNIPLPARGRWGPLAEALSRVDPRRRPQSVAEVRVLFERIRLE